jgi:menaquinol-cytochrome c reductase cytochrome b/c subunit
MAEKEKSFDKVEQPTKTYSLVELVKAPTIMVDKGPENTVFAFPLVAIIEIIMTLVVTVALLTMSFAVNAPLEDLANPNVTTNPAKAPWYFMGLQEMLEHGHPTLMAVMLPTLMVLFVLIIPYLDNSREGAGKWFTNARGKKFALYTAIYTLIMMPIYIVLDSTFPLREIYRNTLPDFILQYVFPAIIMGIVVTLPVIVLYFSKPNAREVVLVLFTVLFVGAVVFTIAGFLFRGPGFELYWPWNMPGGYNPFQNL